MMLLHYVKHFQRAYHGRQQTALLLGYHCENVIFAYRSSQLKCDFNLLPSSLTGERTVQMAAVV